MKDLTKLADALENIAHMEYPSGHHDGNNLREAAALLRAAGAADVAGLMVLHDEAANSFNDWHREGTDALYAEKNANRAALESALRVAMAPKPELQPIGYIALDALKPCPFCGCKMPADGGHEEGCYFTVLESTKDAPPGDVSWAPELLSAWNRRVALNANPQTQTVLVDCGEYGHEKGVCGNAGCMRASK